MIESQFDDVSVMTQAEILFDGRCVRREVHFKDGKKKILVILLPSIEEVQFTTQMSERIEILSGVCEVKKGEEETFTSSRAGHSFLVKGNSSYVLKCDDSVLQYVCHFEG